MLFYTFISGDFNVYNTSLTFNPSDVNETLCGIFRTVDDNIVENNETFYFQAAVQNSMDSFEDGNSAFQLSVYDDDGKLNKN